MNENFHSSLENDIKCARESLIELPMSLNNIDQAQELTEDIKNEFKMIYKRLAGKLINLTEQKIKTLYLKNWMFERTIEKKEHLLPVEKRVYEEFTIKTYERFYEK